ncbi:hypothetical protein DFJ58DRAFT_749896 [Suillus subalutaceus]|uniref:uncharacterized protein n=1 Tax=Suillus subalutaceus TaxID=48586 RepID=UPI001B874C38|nr:uncharacterized protein DFJ58DRAFT_749896 [Suillus subalutaceus]KAG1836169.1 hypothetical protein DFJ58DRAFT_749896 [Suillus subalutaceus]
MNSHYTPAQAAQIALPLAPRGVNNVFIVLVTSVLYDFMTNLGDELDYLLGSRMTLAKGLFLGCRYTTFAICAIHARMVLSPSVEGCPGLTESNILLLGIVLLCAECIFVLRTYALWNCDRRVRIALLILYLALFCATIILVLGCGLQLKNTKFTTGCYSDSSIPTNLILAPYILLLLLEIEVVGLTFYRMIRYYRTTRCRLLTLMAQYNVGYILAGLLSTIINIVAICFVPGDYAPVLEALQIVAQALLATRMQLDLWKLNRHSPSVAPTSYSTEYSQTDLEFELSQRASTIPSGTVPVICDVHVPTSG